MALNPMEKSQDKKKYSNLFKRFFINRFLARVGQILIQEHPDEVLDIGCGEGYPDAYFLKCCPKIHLTGVDLNVNLLAKAKKRNPQANYQKGDILNLNFSSVFDMALVLEVLEHLDEPGKAVKEVLAVSPKAIYSVPFEPWFSIMSLVSGSYLATFGRHPEHIHAWSPGSFKQFLSNYYNKVEVIPVLPWIIAVCEK